MDRIETFTAVLRHEVADYVRPSPNSTAYYLDNLEQQSYAVVIVPEPNDGPSMVMVMARIVDERIVIEADITNKPLFEALMQAGIPREQIILAYEGEMLPAA